MKKTVYRKLVRDRIPEIIEQSGRTCSCSVLSDEDYLKRLDEKLNEELAEYQEDKSMEELADLLAADGRRVNSLVKGMNIIKTTSKDGKTVVKKVIVK